MKTTVYTLSHPTTGEVRYVGKTVGSLAKRLSNHVKDSKKRRSHREKWIMSLADQGLKPVITFVDSIEHSENEPEGNWLEMAYIAQYRAEGKRLVNATDGGEGVPGLKHSAETRAKISAALTPEIRAKMSAIRMGIVFSPEHIAKLTHARHQRVTSPETRTKMSVAQKARRLAEKQNRENK
jgi:hypothetical protein